MTQLQRRAKKLEFLQYLGEWLELTDVQLLDKAREKFHNIKTASRNELILFLCEQKLDEID